MNGLSRDVGLVRFEVRNLQTADRVDGDRKRLLCGLRRGGLPQSALRLAQRAQHLRAVESLPLTVFAEAHRDSVVPFMTLYDSYATTASAGSTTVAW